jgi:tRNA1(Val) A37 N6-methylase TrmN6
MTSTPNPNPERPQLDRLASAALSRHLAPSELVDGVPVSVWLTGQQTSRHQRAGRYTQESIAHPAKMLPAIANHAIATYTKPGQVVLDPMCGIGTTIAEAARLGRTGLGIEYEHRWAVMARRNLELAKEQGTDGDGHVWRADSRHLPPELTDAYTGRVDFVLTSPPYGKANHGQVAIEGRAGHHGPIAKWDHRYSQDRANLGRRSGRIQLAGFTDILRAIRPLLAPGGRIAITARPYRLRGYLVDLPSAVIDAGRAAGLVPVERIVVLLAKYAHDEDGEHLVGRPSFFQMQYVRQARARGIPLSLLCMEDLIVLAADPDGGE